MGRHSEYTEEMADKICLALSSEVIALKTLCDKDEYPCLTTVYKWLKENPDFAKRYTRAREAQADIMAEDILRIADDSSGDTETRYNSDGEEYTVQNHEFVNRSKLKIEARKWLAAKLLPKKYSEKFDIDHKSDGERIVPQIVIMPRKEE